MSDTPQPLVVLGSGPFAEEVADLISEVSSFELMAFVEGIDRERCGRRLLGLPVLWVEELTGLGDAYRAVCAVGSTRRAGFIQEASRAGLKFATLVHPSARVSPTASLGEGTIVSAGTVLAAQSTLGRHVILNRGSLIGHHAVIGDYVTIGPGANLAGKVRISDQVYIAMGAIVLDRISIGRQSVVGAGAVVTRDVPDRVQVVGIPASVIKENIEGL